jgi:ABC-type phosphate/phosphonate transport system ATPase subunit
MPTRASNARRPRDTNQLAWQIVQEATGQAPVEPEKPDTRNPAAVALSKLGASKGGKARAESLSKRQRVEIAKKAARSLD